MKRRKDDNKKRGPLPLCSSTSLILGVSDIGHGSKWIFHPCVSQNYIFSPLFSRLQNCVSFQRENSPRSANLSGNNGGRFQPEPPTLLVTTPSIWYGTLTILYRLQVCTWRHFLFYYGHGCYYPRSTKSIFF
jgi:hypothetical protein